MEMKQQSGIIKLVDAGSSPFQLTQKDAKVNFAYDAPMNLGHSHKFN
jgi:hypothetical protein